MVIDTMAYPFLLLAVKAVSILAGYWPLEFSGFVVAVLWVIGVWRWVK